MAANTTTIFTTQKNDLGNLFIAGRNITIEANGRISSLASFDPESIVPGNITEKIAQSEKDDELIEERKMTKEEKPTEEKVKSTLLLKS